MKRVGVSAAGRLDDPLGHRLGRAHHARGPTALSVEIKTKRSAPEAAAVFADPGDGEDRRRLGRRALRLDLDRQGGNPRTVMGATRRWPSGSSRPPAQRNPQTRFTIVRFGNVLASSGSVVPIFRSQIEQGGPVTVTHPEMTRYFMTIPESVQLVIQAGDLGGAVGEVFVLEMGEPVRIIDLARNMIRLAGYEPDDRHRDRDHRRAPGREDPRGALQRRRARAADRSRADRAGGAGDSRSTRTGSRRRSTRLEALVASGDEAGLAEHVVELMGAEGSARRTLGLIDKTSALSDPTNG